MVGVGYGKGAPIDEGKVRWVTPEELDGLRAGGASLRILDARDDTEFQAGTIPGAMSCGQTAIMFTTGQVKPLLDEVVAGPEGERIVLFANTAGPNTGMTAGREVYVMSYLHELGVPMEKMARLSGGFFGWQKSGRPVEMPGAAAARVDDLESFLADAQLAHLEPTLANETLRGLADDAVANRTAFLQRLKELGVSKLTDRQGLANALSKARRNGAFG